MIADLCSFIYLFSFYSLTLAPVYPVSKFESYLFAEKVLPLIQSSTVGSHTLVGVQRMLPLGGDNVTSDLTYFWETISTSGVCVYLLLLFSIFCGCY